MYAGRVCVHEKDWRCGAQVTPARSPCWAHVVCVPRLRQRQSFLRTLFSPNPKTILRTPNTCCVTAYQSSCIRRRGGLLLLGALIVPHSNAAVHARLLLFVRMFASMYVCASLIPCYEVSMTPLFSACLGVSCSCRCLSMFSCADIGYSHVSFAGSRSACSLRSECSISFSRQWCVR